MNTAATIRLTIEEHVFRVTPKEANLIGDALGKLPYDDVQALIAKLRAQANAQIDAAARARIEGGASGIVTCHGADVGLPQQRIFPAEDAA